MVDEHRGSRQDYRVLRHDAARDRYVQPMGHREYGLLAPGMIERLRVTTDPEYFEEHAESLELWSPGNTLFKGPELLAPSRDGAPAESLKELLEIA